MIYMFLAAIFGMFSLSFFSINFSLQGLNRTVIYTPIELLSMDVHSLEGRPLFTAQEIEEHIRSYYDKTLPRYCRNYEVEFYFYNQEDESMCLSSYCDALEISVTARIMLTYDYHRVMYYELVG